MVVARKDISASRLRARWSGFARTLFAFARNATRLIHPQPVPQFAPQPFGQECFANWKAISILLSDESPFALVLPRV